MEWNVRSIQGALHSRTNRILRLKSYSTRYIFLRALELFRLSFFEFISLYFFRIKCFIRGIKCGKKIYVYGNIVIRGPGKIIIGNGISMNSSSWRCSSSSISSSVRLRTCTYDPGGSNKIIIEDGVGLQGTSITARSTTICIGKNTLIGPDCMITDSDFHQVWPPSERDNPGFENDAPVTIGNSVWIASRCIILKGVTIGDNSVIITGSVVVSSIPRNSLAGGNPAKVLKIFPEI